MTAKCRFILRLCATAITVIVCAGGQAEALEIGTQFNPSAAGSLCGIGVDPTTGDVWIHECNGDDVQRYSGNGTYQDSVPSPGESANDVDLDFTPEAMTLNALPLAAGTMLFINGETDTADVYAVDKTTGAVIASLSTGFGVSHVVGGAYHPGRDTIFLVQDRLPGSADENRIAEVHPATGAVLNTFQIGTAFDVNYGDMDVCSSSGHLFVVSSREDSVAEFTPDGSLVTYHQLPSGVSSLSGIAIDDSSDVVWVSSVGNVTSLMGLPCGSLFSDGFETGDTSMWSSSFP